VLNVLTSSANAKSRKSTLLHGAQKTVPAMKYSVGNKGPCYATLTAIKFYTHMYTETDALTNQTST